jgi:CheY-like chemotaxis protein/HPt (histidine-containing phosphotransfer) domain-containing protein
VHQENIMSNQNPVILAVDDDSFNLDIIDEFTSGKGFELLTAENGEKALAILRCGRPKVDVVLLDRMMPGMDGLEVLQEIKKDPELGMIPVILLTAASEQAQVAEGVNAGCFYYLTKPFDRIVLNKVLSAALREQTGQESAAFSIDAPTSLPPAQPAEPHLPGLAVARGLEIWKKATVYKQYLRKFAHNYAGCVPEMAQAERAAAASTAHKLKGSAGNLAIVDVAAITAELDHALRTGESPASYYIRLQAAMDIALGSIAQYAALDLTVDSVPSLNYKRERLFPLLDRLMRAFNIGSPDEIKPAVAELGKVLPTCRLNPIYIAMENFDFRGGEAATRSIVAELCL